MLGLDSSARFEMYVPPTDMRKSFDSLCGIIRSELDRIPNDKTVYIFMNRLHVNPTAGQKHLKNKMAFVFGSME